MIFPFVVSNANSSLVANFDTRFSNKSGYDRSIKEVVWRRHQSQQNSKLSGWMCQNDARRRMLHFRDKYAIENNNLIMRHSYIFLAIKAPAIEITDYTNNINDFLVRGGWTDSSAGFVLNNLICKTNVMTSNQLDVHPFTDKYLDLHITIMSANQDTEQLFGTPWKLLRNGIRQVKPRGTPRISKLQDLVGYLPAQVELGCGPSIESGIPPLNYFHKLYSTINENGTFVLKPDQDSFLENILVHTEGTYERIAHIHKQCLIAEPTEFYKSLKTMHDKNLITGPILTNNFDGLCLSVGLDEYCLRQYDTTGVYPTINFDQNAKSLLVIGSHADRRTTVAQARANNMQIIFIDPETYGESTYSLESPQDNDIVINATASEFAKFVNDTLV